MTGSGNSDRRVLTTGLRVFAAFAIVTGALDLSFGSALLAHSGARLGDAATDPLLDSQMRYLGATWAGFGGVLWWAAGDLVSRGTVLKILAAAVFAGGLGRLASEMVMGPSGVLVKGFIALELLGPPVVLLFRARLVQRLERNQASLAED